MGVYRMNYKRELINRCHGHKIIQKSMSSKVYEAKLTTFVDCKSQYGDIKVVLTSSYTLQSFSQTLCNDIHNDSLRPHIVGGKPNKR